MEDSELFLDPDEDGSTISVSKEKPCGRGSNRPALHSSVLHFPLSSSTPSALAEVSVLTHGTTAAHSSMSCIIKSSSSLSEKESKESTLLRANPMLALVESLSMEISHKESEYCLSNSDSTLHLQPWKQLGQLPKSQDDEPLARTVPSSPTGSRPNLISSGSLLMAELEDKRRKLSEAMQEPLSKLSKIIGEDSGSPKSQKGDLLSSQGGAAGGIPTRSEDGAGGWHKENGNPLAVCETPLRKPRRELKPSFTPELCCKLGSDSSRYEICTYGDVLQVLEIQEHSGRAEVKHQGQKGVKAPPAIHTTSSDPGRWLLCVGLLAYSFFVLPLSSYMTGLSLGLACGFMLGLTMVMMLTPQRSAATEMPIPSPIGSLLMESIALRETAKRELQGWMNEIYSYDPETYHPSLCHSVYVTLDGCNLRLAYPRVNIPQQATFNEATHDTTFVRRTLFPVIQLQGQVSLLPSILAKKRVWNRKYPICITLAAEQQCVEVEQVCDSAEAKNERAEKVEKEVHQITILYLFGRTGREKEEWYQHFMLASKTKTCWEESKPEVCSAGGSSQGSNDDLASMLGLRELAGSVREKILLDYNSYMAHFITPESCSLTPSPCHSEPGSLIDTKRFSSDPVAECGDPNWINAMIGRIFWDFLQEKYWADQVAHKIQKKLSKIRLPYFMNELTIAELDLGTCIPQVLSTSRPSVDHRGLWLELEVLYTGSLHMTLETKMNLCKLGRESCSEVYSITEPNRIVGPRVCIIADSDEESSSAGSSDEEEMMPSEPQGPLRDNSVHSGSEGHGGSTSRKILRFVDKIAKSKYFQKATENEYIKKKISEVSNTPLLLSVEVLELSGTLAVNIPQPPTDRIWYSFRVPPRLDLRVKPMLGERELTFTHVTEWIERKLQCEFQKIFVMPNMDDVYLPLMSSGMDNTDMSQNFSRESQDQQPEQYTNEKEMEKKK